MSRRPTIPNPGDTTPYGTYAAIAAVIAFVFLYLGQPMAEWIVNGRVGNPYGLQWTDGPLAGQAVAYRDVSGGTIWRDAACLATAFVLGIEASLYAMVVVRRSLAPALLPAIAIVAAAGVGLNIVSAVLQIAAGFTAPLYALIGVVICGLSATTAWRHRTDAA